MYMYHMTSVICNTSYNWNLNDASEKRVVLRYSVVRGSVQDVFSPYARIYRHSNAAAVNHWVTQTHVRTCGGYADTTLGSRCRLYSIKVQRLHKGRKFWSTFVGNACYVIWKGYVETTRRSATTEIISKRESPDRF